MAAGYYNIIIEQNATFQDTFAWTDSTGAVINLTGYTAAMKIKDLNGNILLDVSNVPGGLTINATAGTVAVVIPKSYFASWTARNAKYDMVLTSSGLQDTRLIQGIVSIQPGVTS